MSRVIDFRGRGRTSALAVLLGEASRSCRAGLAPRRGRNDEGDQLLTASA